MQYLCTTYPFALPPRRPLQTTRDNSRLLNRQFNSPPFLCLAARPNTTGSDMKDNPRTVRHPPSIQPSNHLSFLHPPETKEHLIKTTSTWPFFFFLSFLSSVYCSTLLPLLLLHHHHPAPGFASNVSKKKKKKNIALVQEGSNTTPSADRPNNLVQSHATQ
ncbi:hypothetical protein B0J11DRAFT_536138 [Dendryphion nanum]|uniref:Uncharacterized protein n=1 Tax=Dendryphion nanum TaxID=256645 RepID=A0A9P9DH83_9PLEO|nr:hypothetical protein B0J11DRAFT_536138 [Dendryphion nanum]